MLQWFSHSASHRESSSRRNVSIVPSAEDPQNVSSCSIASFGLCLGLVVVPSQAAPNRERRNGPVAIIIDEVTVDGTAGEYSTLTIKTVDTNGVQTQNSDPHAITVACQNDNFPDACQFINGATSFDTFISKAGTVEVVVYSELAYTFSVTVTADSAGGALIAGIIPRDITFNAGV